MNNVELYGSLPRISETIRGRRLRLARTRTTYIEIIKADTGLENTKEIRDAMLDQVVWKDFFRRTWDDSWPK